MPEQAGASEKWMTDAPDEPSPAPHHRDPAICHGKPCVRGLRYPVETVLEWLATGMDIGGVKFLVDAQLPRRDVPVAGRCRSRCAAHTLDLPGLTLGNRTPDEALISQADELLWLIAMGNADNRSLEALVRHALPKVEHAFASGGFVELGRDRLQSALERGRHGHLMLLAIGRAGTYSMWSTPQSPWGNGRDLTPSPTNAAATVATCGRRAGFRRPRRAPDTAR